MQNGHSLDSAPSRGKWLALAAALLGWMFDGLEMGLFPLVAKPALGELLPGEKDTVVVAWLAVITAIFLIGAATGGVLFGWLGDRIGRVRAMTLSILTYALFSGACGFANEAWQVAVLRFVASMGMGGEWSLGVALVMEVWPNRSRALLAGLIGAVANFGYVLIAVAGMGLNEIIGELGQFLLNIGLSTEMKDHLVGNSGWRLLMFFGAFPAVLTLLIQFFVPESHRWAEEKKTGSVSHWQTRDLFGVLIGAAAACGMLALLATDLLARMDIQLFHVVNRLTWPWRFGGCLAAFLVVLGGYLYPIVRYMHRQGLASFRGAKGDHDVAAQQRENSQVLKRMLVGAALSGVALLGTWGTIQQAPFWAASLPGGDQPNVRNWVQISGGGGAIVGCLLAAMAGQRFGRRKAYFFMCAASMLSIFGLFELNAAYGKPLLAWAFVAGAMTASFYGWLPLYLPELFKTRVRATGQGFGFNFGRVLAAIGVMQLPVIMRELRIGFDKACPAISLVYIVGMILIWFAPETKGKPLPDDL